MKLKCPNLLKPLGTIIQENYQPFYPSEPFRITHFNMRHPVVNVQTKRKIVQIFVAFSEKLNFTEKNYT
jgi:hypothetical protein